MKKVFNRNINFYPRAGLQDLCNAQSSKGFACVEKFLLQENTAFQDRIRMTAGKVFRFEVV
jgi:hypothetical protein